RFSLLSLVDKSLLRQSMPSNEVKGASGRFEMHEVLRQYAAEKLDELPDEREGVQGRHASYYVELAELADREVRGEGQDKWLERLEREHDNLRAVLGWAIETNQVEVGLRLGGALPRFWFIRGYFSEGRAALRAVLGATSWRESPVPLRG